MAKLSAENDWTPLIKVTELLPRDATLVQHNGRALAVFDTHSGLTVSEARCPHAGANLCDGYFDGNYIECPLHQGVFDACTGLAVAAPANRPLKMIACRVIGGTLEIRTEQLSK